MEQSNNEKAAEENIVEINGRKVNTNIFTQGFVAGCDLNICHGHCCYAGVYMDKDFKPVILQHKDIILEAMDENQVKDINKWFDEEEPEDSDFPSGIAAGTAVYTDPTGYEKCVFNDKNNFCSLQVAAVNNGMHKWAIKPFHCIMYPVTVVDETVQYDGDHSVDLNYCGKHNHQNFIQSAFDGAKDEIKYVLGEDFYNALLEYYKANYPEGYKKDILKDLVQIEINKSD